MSRASLETPCDGLANVFQGLGLRASLGDAAGNRMALSNQHAGLVGFQRHKELHTWILFHVASDDGVPDIRGRGRSNIVIIGAEEVLGCQTQTAHDRPVYCCRSSRVPWSAHVPRNTHPGRRCVGAGQFRYGLGEHRRGVAGTGFQRGYHRGRSARQPGSKLNL